MTFKLDYVLDANAQLSSCLIIAMLSPSSPMGDQHLTSNYVTNTGKYGPKNTHGNPSVPLVTPSATSKKGLRVKSSPTPVLKMVIDAC